MKTKQTGHKPSNFRHIFSAAVDSKYAFPCSINITLSIFSGTLYSTSSAFPASLWMDAN